MRFSCPHCQKTIRAPESQAGRQARCPACGEAITIPPTPTTSPESGSEGNRVDSPRNPRRRRRRPWWLAALAGIVLLAAAGVAARYLLEYEEAPTLPAISLYNTTSETFVARTGALPGETLQRWRKALQETTREYVTRHELLFVLPNMDRVWEGKSFAPDIAAALKQRIASVPRSQILRWHRALDIASERTVRVPLWDTALRLVEIDRIFDGQSFDIQASNSLLERFRSVSQRDFARWAAALDAERGQAAIMLVCTDGFFEEDAFDLQRFVRGTAGVERLREGSR